MTLLRSLAMALSCFSKVPVPQVDWKPESMRYMMCFFPVVGLIIGVVLALWWLLCDAVGFGSVLRGTGLVLLPGLMDSHVHFRTPGQSQFEDFFSGSQAAAAG